MPNPAQADVSPEKNHIRETTARSLPDRDRVGRPQLLALADLDVDPVNPRRDPGDVDDLAASIGSQGILQPLLVRPLDGGRYGVVCGSRRRAAALSAGLTHVPCVVRDLDDLDAAIAGGTENLARSDLNPIEEAELYQALLARTRLGQYRLAKQLGVSQPKVAQRLKLLELPKPIQRQVADGRMSIHAAYKLAKTDRGALSNPRKRTHQVVVDDVPDDDGPRRIHVPAGYWPLTLPADIATAVRSCARRRDIPAGAWVVEAIREKANRENRRGDRR